MKRICSLLLTFVLLLGLAACGQKAPTWQEQYDLGVKYLSEGNYEEAIIAFTAAIEIDPKKPEAYVGRGDAYIGSGETEENLAAALADYEKAVVLDDTIPSLYLKLADIYLRQDDYKGALEILQRGFTATGDELIQKKLDEIRNEHVHTPTEATCTEPSICSVCGETLAEALEHTWAEPTYQQPSICVTCGETKGEPLTPDFVKFAVKGRMMEVGKTYDYVTGCYQNDALKTTGRVTITDYRIFDSDDTHEAKEGYEWKSMSVEAVYYDENAQAYGFEHRESILPAGYYTVDDPYDDLNDGDLFTVDWYGQEYTECTWKMNRIAGDWVNGERVITSQHEFRVPVGYDGIVSVFFDSTIELSEDDARLQNLNDDSLLFRWE